MMYVSQTLHRKFVITVLILVIGTTTLLSAVIPSRAVAHKTPLSYVDILRGGYVDLDRIREHVLFLTQNCSPRVTGYPGSYRAAEYIKRTFEELGLEDVSYQWYNLTVPIDMGGRLKVYSPDMALLLNLSVYPLWPNSVHTCSTPPEGLMGPLFYVGKGEYGDYVGRDVEGGIVLLDFNSRDNWKRAVSLGAKAVLFVEPDSTSITESELKYLKFVPLNVPRAYVEKRDASAILDALERHGGELKARLITRVEWQVKRVPNVVAYKTGTGLKDQWIVLFAHYDAWSVVPGMAEGATDACGISALLELARFFSEVETRRSFMFVAFSGFGQGIAGARSFVDKLVWESNFTRALPEKAEDGKGMFLQVGIDLSPETTVSGMVYTSYFYRIYRMGVIGRGAFIRDLDAPFFKDRPGFVCFTRRMEDAWKEVYGRTWMIEGAKSFDDFAMEWDQYFPSPFVTDGDAFTAAQVQAGGGAKPGSHQFTYRTAHSYFWRRGTPLDSYSRLEDIENLRPQLEFIFCSLYDLANTNLEEMLYEASQILNREKLLLGGLRFGRLVGQVVRFDVKTGYYKPVPNAIVQISASDPARLYRHWWFEMADENGVFMTTGLSDRIRYEIAPYVLNQTTGRIVYAPDKGMYGSQAFPHEIIIHYSVGYRGTKEAPYPVVAFPCGSIEIFNMKDSQPVSGVGLAKAIEGWTAFERRMQISVNDARTHFETDHYGYVTESDVGIAFVQGGIPAELILSFEDRPEVLIGLLHNADAENPEHGRGYLVNEGETLRLTHTALHFARDLYYLNDYRTTLCEEKKIFVGVEQYHRDAEARLKSALEGLREKRPDSYYKYAISSWALETQAHGILRDDMRGIINTTMASFVLLIPFAFIAERLFFSHLKGTRRMLSMCGIFIASLALLALFHPGFAMATNVFVVLIGLAIAALTTPILLLLFGGALGAFK
ncbi:TPA: M28 family peptidase, partial [Candidatus Bathyarchaeota archaeon]|nr:M28 family peptidase [Candidatus Bathyarchaeota archaeon]